MSNYWKSHATAQLLYIFVPILFVALNTVEVVENVYRKIKMKIRFNVDFNVETCVYLAIKKSNVRVE